MTDDRVSAFRSAYDGLVELIATDRFTVGEPLRESALSELLGVSRTPVREALRRLAAEGLVDILPNRGAIFRGFSREDLVALIELRARLEPYAVRLAIPQLDEEDLADLGLLVRQMQEALAAADLDRLGGLNDRFHQTFLRRSGNRLLAGSLTAVVRPTIVLRTFHHYSPRALERSMGHHVELLEAAADGSAEWGEAVMRAHILAGRSTVLNFADS